MQIVLASRSPYRQAQLKAFGVDFISQAPKVDEAELKRVGPKDLPELTRFLALKKAESLAADFPQALILGSDQMACYDGQRLDKPGERARALAQLKTLAGREHQLITSLALLFQGQRVVDTEVTTIRMRACDERTLERYLDTDQPYDCAGAYKVERAGLALIESVEGRDPSAIQGLPLISLTRGLLQLGLSPETLWRMK